MRKGLIALALPLLLLCAQQGALRHVLGHDLAQMRAAEQAAVALSVPAAGQGGAAPRGQPHAADKLCQICLAYAGMAAPLQATLPLLVLLEAHDAQPQPPGRPRLGGSAPAPRSRGPPRALEPTAT
ncbi:MAG: hypothetical protein KGI90_02845 [Burkholderiales bacterium]|nr:hypothetical protein [Burkholderiales bacterium]